MFRYEHKHQKLATRAVFAQRVARSLLFGGVARRHPGLRFAFQEGGVALASSLFADVLGHWTKRNRDAVRHYDPAFLDVLESLVPL